MCRNPRRARKRALPSFPQLPLLLHMLPPPPPPPRLRLCFSSSSSSIKHRFPSSASSIRQTKADSILLSSPFLILPSLHSHSSFHLPASFFLFSLSLCLSLRRANLIKVRSNPARAKQRRAANRSAINLVVWLGS